MSMVEQTSIRPPAREIRVVDDVVPILDTARFEHMQRIAGAMAQGSLIPETLRGFYEGSGQARKLVPFETATTVSNVFRVVNQAVRWNMDPFAVIDHASVVHGRLMWEGKLVHAVVEARIGIRLQYVFGRMIEVAQPSGTKALMFSDDEEGEGEHLAVQVIGHFSDEETRRTIEGTVRQWKTTGTNTPWGNPLNFKRQLRYRGAREWARAHAPGVMLGVLTDDEILEDVGVLERVEGTRSGRRPKADLVGKLTADKSSEGFNAAHVEAQTGADVIEGEAVETSTGPGGRDDAAIAEGKQAEPVKAGQVNAVEARKAALALAQKKGDEAYQAALVDDQEAITALQDGAVTEEQSDYIRNGILKAERELADQREQDGGGEDGDASDAVIEGQATETQDPSDEDVIENLRLTAYEDGFSGEPLQAVLAECETDEEREIAASEHERGVQARIAKEAEEHKASEAAAAAAEKTFDFEVVGGAAPKGDAVYLLTSDEPGKDGKLPTYKAGAQFSRVGPKGANTLKAYDGHAEPADPALASQSGGTAAKAEETGGLYAELAAKDSWLAIKPELSKIYGTDDFKALTPEDQAATRAHLFGAVLEMKERTKDPVDWANDPSAFALFADHTASRDDLDPTDAADQIDGTFQTLQGSKLWQDKLTPATQGVLTERVQAMLTRLRSA